MLVAAVEDAGEGKEAQAAHQDKEIHHDLLVVLEAKDRPTLDVRAVNLK